MRRIRINSNKVILQDENHRINRRAMLFSMYDEYLEEYREEDNWILRDQIQGKLNQIEDALKELLYAKVGDELTYYVVL